MATIFFQFFHLKEAVLIIIFFFVYMDHAFFLMGQY